MIVYKEKSFSHFLFIELSSMILVVIFRVLVEQTILHATIILFFFKND